MKILLHSNQLNLGGTETALWDYALGCWELLGHHVVIASPHGGVHHPGIVEKFCSRFPVILYPPGTLSLHAKYLGVDAAYFITDGRRNEELLIPGIRNVVHAVFSFYEPHGDVYAYVSEWLAQTASGGKCPWVPHIVRPLPNGTGGLRAKLGIPEKAIVFGGYGRQGQFDIPFVHEAVKKVASSLPVYFLFMNFTPFAPAAKNLIFLPGTALPAEKASFIDACDAMLHARSEGETFGLAVAEFSMRNKPVITYGESRDRAHLAMLGNKAHVYHNYSELVIMLATFERAYHRMDSHDWNAYHDFSPTKVMAKFDSVFLKA